MDDEKLLQNSFYVLLQKQNNLEMVLRHDPSFMWRDGFEEPIDEGTLSTFLLELADRCGYVLKDGMWVNK